MARHTSFKWIFSGMAAVLCGAVAESAELKKRNYRSLADEMGVVLLDVNWSRRWDCGGYENAQLLSLDFENVLQDPREHSDYSQIVLGAPSRLSASGTFQNYGFIVEPGNYAFSGWELAVAKSVQDVGRVSAKREELIDGDRFLGGTFSVSAGEVIYIGNFFLDCYDTPIPWRYYTEGESGFDRHSSQYKGTFDFLEEAEIQYRLLDTETYGTDYALPE